MILKHWHYLKSNLVIHSRSMSKAKASKQNPPQKKPPPVGPITKNKSGDILIQVFAKPGAKTNSVTSLDEDGVGIQISARPVDGEANAELIKYLTSVLLVRKSDISLDKGSKSRQKTVIITNKELSTEDILEKLKTEMKG